jgi:hypothetical protein
MLIITQDTLLGLRRIWTSSCIPMPDRLLRRLTTAMACKCRSSEVVCAGVCPAWAVTADSPPHRCRRLHQTCQTWPWTWPPLVAQSCLEPSTPAQGKTSTTHSQDISRKGGLQSPKRSACKPCLSIHYSRYVPYSRLQAAAAHCWSQEVTRVRLLQHQPLS